VVTSMSISYADTDTIRARSRTSSRVRFMPGTVGLLPPGR
jgi:hypothetical protein